MSRSINKIASTIIFLLIAAAPTQAAQKQRREIAEISFQTGGNTCGGPCADYTVTIHSDGKVTYEGRVNVKHVGVKNVSVPRTNFDLLARKASEIRFFELHDYYGSVELDGASMSITDLPTRIVTVVDRRGARKTVEDYLGAPKRLYEFEQLIEKLTTASTLAGTPPDEDNLPYYDTFPMNKTVTFRGVVSLIRYGGGASANAPKWTSAYELSLPKSAMQFELEAPAGIDLSQLVGWIVDATGKLTKRGVTGEHMFRANKIQRVRKSGDFAPSK